MSWTDQALCTQSDPDAWFPEDLYTDRTGLRFGEQKQLREHAARTAKSLCRQCPSRAECLEEGLTPVVLSLSEDGGQQARLPHGIWGGLDLKQRNDILRGRGVAIKAQVPGVRDVV